MQQKIKDLLSKVKKGTLSPAEAYSRLKNLPYEDLGFAKYDHHRSLRKGFPEVIFCPGKTTPQIISIMQKAIEHHNIIMATRAEAKIYKAVKKTIKGAKYYKEARIIVLEPRTSNIELRTQKKSILVMTAGTADIPVAEEAAVTAEVLGNKVERLFDVGVAGIHRLFSQLKQVQKADVLIVVAGMEGALASVVAGLVDKPVIAVPTSVGYGASFKGLSALLTMMNSCSPGVAVVNIDNGFGAAVMAHMINN
jgi:NCAIR mutase (PurE)-related protein